MPGGRSSAGWRAGRHTALQCGRRCAGRRHRDQHPQTPGALRTTLEAAGATGSHESAAAAGVPAAQYRLDQLHLRRCRLRLLHPNRHRRLHLHRNHRSPHLCHHPHSHPHPLLRLHRHYLLPRHLLACPCRCPCRALAPLALAVAAPLARSRRSADRLGANKVDSSSRGNGGQKRNRGAPLKERGPSAPPLGPLATALAATAAATAAKAPAAAAATTAAPESCATMASLRVLAFNQKGRPVAFDTWHDDLQLYILSDIKDSVSLFDHVSGVATAPPATANGATRSQWLSRDATVCLAIRNHLPVAECIHFGRHKTAHALYDAVVARHSSPATAALNRLLLPYLFPGLSTFATVADLVTHLRTSDARYRATVPAEDHFLSLDPTSLTVDLLEQHLLTAETNAVAVGAARGTPRSTFFEGCSPSPLSPSFASAAAVDVSVTEDVGVASTSVKHCSSKGKDGRGGGGGSGGGGGGSGSGGGGSGGGGGGSGGGGGGGTGGGSGGSGGGGGGSGGSGGSGGGGTGGGRSGPRRGGPCGGQRQQQQQRRSKTQSPQQLREWLVSRGPDGGSESCPYVIRTGVRAGQTCGRLHTEHRCFSRLDDAWRAEFAAAALGTSASSTSPGIAPAKALHTFTLDSGASRCFFRDSTTLTLLLAPVPLRLADPSGGPDVACSSTVLPCPAVPSGSLSGLHLPSFSTNLVSAAALQDAMGTTTTPEGQRVSICTCTQTGRHLATFTHRPGSSLYTLDTEPPQVAASAQVSASGQVAASCSCRLVSHQTLLWHHRLGHPSLPRLRGMHSRLLVSGLPRSLPPLTPSPALPCLPCVEERQRAAPHSSFPPTTAPLQTLPMDVWGPARVSGQGRERYLLLVVDDYTWYTTVFPLRSKGEVSDVLIPWIRTVRLQLHERFGKDLPVLRLHSDRAGEFSSDHLRDLGRGEGILHSFTLPDSPQQNGIAERHIGLVMEVARTSMIHAAAPHFLWPFAVQYAAHQLNLWPRVSLPETSPTLHWTGKVGDASVFRKFYHPTSRHVLPSYDDTIDESVPFYRLFPYRSAPPPPPSLFLAPGPPPVDSLLPQGPAPSGVSQVDTLLSTAPVQVAVGSGAAPGAASGGAELGGAGSEGAGSGGAEPRGAEPEGAESEGAESGGAAPRGAASSGGARDTGAGGAAVTAGAGGTGGAAATGLRGARTSGAGVAGAGGVGPLRTGGAGGTVRLRPYFFPLVQQVLGVLSSTDLTPPLLCPPPDQSQLPLQPSSPLPAPSPYTEQSDGLTERREPASRPVSPVYTTRRVPRSRPPSVPVTHAMALRLSSVPLRVPLHAPPESSLPEVPDPESDRAHAASPTFARLLATAVTHPSFESAFAFASPPSVGGECALGMDVLEDRQEDFECLAAAVPRFASMLLAPEGDPDAPDIPTPRSYPEAITGPYSSQWQAAMDVQMASWKSTSTYVDKVPPPRANIGVDYFQTFSPTPKMTTLQVLLHVAAQRDYELHSLDFSTAFLQGNLHEEIWLLRPPGFTESFPAGTQWSLRRPVYGLRQAPREWQDTLRTTLVALGFAPATADPSLFLRTDTSLPPFFVLVYVDDLVFATAVIEALTLVKSELQKRHTCTDLGELRSYLGL
ncbi:unnamed protein product [Closterium sp. NIES-54]